MVPPRGLSMLLVPLPWMVPARVASTVPLMAGFADRDRLHANDVHDLVLELHLGGAETDSGSHPLVVVIGAK